MLNPTVPDSRLPHPPPRAWSTRAVCDTATGLLRSTRPEQWLKNLLVLVAPVAAGRLAAPGAIVELAIAFCMFTVAAGGVYLLNDVRDRHDDERHPVKRHRPVASGRVGATTALGTALTLLGLPAPLLIVLGRPALGAVVAAFVVVNLTYTLAGKHQPYIDVVSVAGSLLLRTLGGATAIGIGLDPLLGLVIFAAALHVISSKRFAEFRDIGPAGRTRPVLARYSFTALTRLRMLSAAAALGAYAAWVLDHAARSAGSWFVVSLLPVVVGFIRFEKIVSEGAGERPERLILRDATLRTSALCTIVALGLAAHAI